MEQKVIITDTDSRINEWLGNGWEIISVTAQHVAPGVNYSHQKVEGKFCFLLQRQIRE